VTKNPDGSTPTEGYLDYTDYATGKNGKAKVFFKNVSDEDGKKEDFDQEDNSIFGEGTGIMIPWVIVSEKNAELNPNYKVYTTTEVPNGEYRKATDQEIEDGVPTVTENGNVYVLDADNQKIPLYDTYYVYSMYPSDVTIVVDYYMILDDNAIVDEPGNKNFAQYGWSPVDNTTGGANPQPKPPTPPTDGDKPSEKEEVDEATVYTFAIAWVKVDEKANQLAGAKFQLPFYVKEDKDGDAYVYGGTTAGDGLINEVETTTESAVITIKGLKEGVYSITETAAPEGYNKLAAPFDVEAKKTGEGETVKTSTKIYLDEKGDITGTETQTWKEYFTDEDSFNKAGAAPEETSVPVYQFDPVVNKTGAELPSTGGIGTTIFYVMGSILVICAGVVLITRRRMAA
jgi:LPXTG-motif cell wall-anchored protein